MACTESRNAASPGLPFRLAKISAPLPSGENCTLALLTGSAPLLSQASPWAMAALSAAVSGASALYTTMTGVPLAAGTEACCRASARLLWTALDRPLEASLVVTLCSLGPIESAPAMTIQTAMTIHGCLPRVHQVMMFRIVGAPSRRWPAAAAGEPSYRGRPLPRSPPQARRASPPRLHPATGSRPAGNRGYH